MRKQVVRKQEPRDEDSIDLLNPDGTDKDGIFTHPKGHLRDMIILHEGKDSPKEGQFVQLNGFAFQILYNKPVALPRPVVQMLQNCVFLEILKDEKTGEEYERRIPRFNITVLEKGVNAKELRPVETQEVKPQKKPGFYTKDNQ